MVLRNVGGAERSVVDRHLVDDPVEVEAVAGRFAIVESSRIIHGRDARVCTVIEERSSPRAAPHRNAIQVRVEVGGVQDKSYVVAPPGRDGSIVEHRSPGLAGQVPTARVQLPIVDVDRQPPRARAFLEEDTAPGHRAGREPQLHRALRELPLVYQARVGHGHVAAASKSRSQVGIANEARTAERWRANIRCIQPADFVRCHGAAGFPKPPIHDRPVGHDRVPVVGAARAVAYSHCDAVVDDVAIRVGDPGHNTRRPVGHGRRVPRQCVSARPGVEGRRRERGATIG